MAGRHTASAERRLCGLAPRPPTDRFWAGWRPDLPPTDRIAETATHKGWTTRPERRPTSDVRSRAFRRRQTLFILVRSAGLGPIGRAQTVASVRANVALYKLLKASARIVLGSASDSLRH